MCPRLGEVAASSIKRGRVDDFAGFGVWETFFEEFQLFASGMVGQGFDHAVAAGSHHSSVERVVAVALFAVFGQAPARAQKGGELAVHHHAAAVGVAVGLGRQLQMLFNIVFEELADVSGVVEVAVDKPFGFVAAKVLAQQAVAFGQAVGFVGALHPELTNALGLDQSVFVFELNLADVAAGRLPDFRELSRFPEVRRDLALLVAREVPAQSMLNAIRTAAGEFLTDLRLFDVYQGKGIDPSSKSVAVGLTWQHTARTLTDEEVNSSLQNVVTALETQFQATLRK